MSETKLKISDDHREHVFSVADIGHKIVLGEVARSRGIKAFVPPRSRSRMVLICSDHEAGQITKIATRLMIIYEVNKYRTLVDILKKNGYPVPNVLNRIIEDLETKSFQDSEGS